MEWTLFESLSAAVVVLGVMMLLPALLVIASNRQVKGSVGWWVMACLLASWLGLALFWVKSRPPRSSLTT